MVVDLQKSLYVVYGENRSSQYAVWLRYFNGSTWSSPSKLSSDGKTGALPAAVAGIAGKVGAAWYQADGDFFPEEAPADTRWSVVYALFENSTGNLSLVQRVSVKDSVHKGPIGGGEPGAPFLGDFLYAARRQGDSTGRVAIGFVCDEGSLTEGCLASGITEKPLPFYAVQTEGPGVL